MKMIYLFIPLFLYCMVFNAVFNVISFTPFRALPGIPLTSSQYSAQYFFQATGCFLT